MFPSLSLLLDTSARTSYDVVVDTALDLTEQVAEPAIVDIGCGDGMLLALYGARRENARLIGIEQSEKEAELARSTLEPFNAEVIVGDVRSTGLAPESADAVVSHMVLMLLDDATGALDEAARVLRPGGGFVAATGYLAPRLGVFEPIGEIVERARKAESARRFSATRALLTSTPSASCRGSRPASRSRTSSGSSSPAASPSTSCGPSSPAGTPSRPQRTRLSRIGGRRPRGGGAARPRRHARRGSGARFNRRNAKLNTAKLSLGPKSR